VTLDHATVDHTSTLACERREGRVAPPKRSLQTIGTPAYRMMSRATRPPINRPKVICISLFHQRSTHLLNCLERIADLTTKQARTKCRPSPERRQAAGPASALMQLDRNSTSARLCPDVCRDQFQVWPLNRLQEKPLDVTHGVRLLPRLFRHVSWDDIEAIPGTVAPLAEPPAPLGNEPNTTIAIWI
jgi:hypothetical protein